MRLLCWRIYIYRQQCLMLCRLVQTNVPNVVVCYCCFYHFLNVVLPNVGLVLNWLVISIDKSGGGGET